MSEQNAENKDFALPDASVIKDKQKAGWIKAWFAIEVVAIGKDIVDKAIKEHMKRMAKAKNTLIIDINYSEPIKTENLSEKIKKKIQEKSGQDKAFSITAEATFLCKNFTTLLELVMMYGPSAIEVLEPKSIQVEIDELQNIANIFSGILHQFAAAGVGGLVISADKKKTQN